MTSHHDERNADAGRREHELASIDAELRKTERAIERYMLAFENGTLPEAIFAGRLEQLTRTTETLQARRAAAVIDVDRDGAVVPGIDDLARVAADLRHAIGEAPETARKAIVQAFVTNLTVQHRQAIQPRYRVLATMPDPDTSGVRTQKPSVVRAGLLSNLRPQIDELGQADSGRRAATKAAIRKQVQRRLQPDEIDELVEAYLDGATQVELAVRFGIHRESVSDHLSRRSAKRTPGLQQADLKEAARLYSTGQSLAAVGRQFGVSSHTVAGAFRAAGITVRRRNGWPG